MRLLAYSRVSTEEQSKNGRSLSIQEAGFLSYCQQHQHELIGIITDKGVSASIALNKRKGGAELLRRLEEGEADGVLCSYADRLFRIGLDAVTVATWLRERGMPILGTQEHIDILDDDGWLLFWLKAGIAERDRLKIVRRAVETSQGLRDSARSFGPVPFGIVCVDGRLYRDATDWAIRERIMRMRADNLSYRAIVGELEYQGVPSPSGGIRWHVSTVRKIIESHSDYQHIPPLPKRVEARVSAGVNA